MKFSWELISNVFAKVLGVETIARNAEGKEVLSEDQRKKLKEHFGPEVLTLYEKHAVEDAGKGDNDQKVVEMTAFLEAVGRAGTDNRAELVKELANAQIKIQGLNDQVTELSKLPEVKPTATGVNAQGVRQFKIDAKHAHNTLAQTFLGSGQMPTISASTINVDEIKSEFGVYSSQGNAIDMLRDIYTGFTTSKHTTKRQAIKSYKATLAHSTSVVQEFSPKWTPTGEADFDPIEIKNYRHKINFSVVPAEVGESWLLHLYNEKLTPDQMPITRYIIQNILMPSILQDIELKMIGKGKYVARTDQTKAGKPENSMDGIETLLVEAAKSGDKGINFYPDAVDLRKSTDAAVLDYIDNFASKITQKYQGVSMNIFLSGEIYKKYKRAYKTKWGAGSGTENADFGKDRVDFTNFSLQVLDCMYGSPIIFCTPKLNFIQLEWLNNPDVISDIQKIDYEVHFIGEFWLGIGFAVGKMVFASVPADYNPQEAISEDGANDFWIAKNKVAGTTTETSTEQSNQEGA